MIHFSLFLTPINTVVFSFVHATTTTTTTTTNYNIIDVRSFDLFIEQRRSASIFARADRKSGAKSLSGTTLKEHSQQTNAKERFFHPRFVCTTT